MKSLTLFLFLLIIESSVSKIKLDDYSINVYIDQMKKEGIFDIVLYIKWRLNIDIAIITCEELKKKKVVIVKM